MTLPFDAEQSVGWDWWGLNEEQSTKHPNTASASGIFADEDHDRILAAYEDKIAVFPLRDASTKEEPFLSVQVSRRDLTVGEEHSITINASDPRVKVDIEEIPAGAKRTESGLLWRPTLDDIKIHSLQVTLSYGNASRVETIPLKVSLPYVKSPINVSEFLLDPERRFAICWTHQNHPNTEEVSKHAPMSLMPRIALVPFRKAIESRVIMGGNLVQQVLLTDKQLFVVTGSYADQIEAYELSTLQHQKTIKSDFPCIKMTTETDRLLVHGRGKTSVYQMIDLSFMRTIVEGDGPMVSVVNVNRYLDGVFDQGIFYEKDTKQPMLLLSRLGLHSVPQQKDLYEDLPFLRRRNPRSSHFVDLTQRHFVLDGPNRIPKRNESVSLECDQLFKDNLLKRTVALQIFDRDFRQTSRVPVVEEEYNCSFQNPLEIELPRMRVEEDGVYVTNRDKIFRWSYKEMDTIRRDEYPLALHFVPRQTSFTIKDPMSELKHEVRGGTPPYRFGTANSIPGIVLDETTGTVVINRDELFAFVKPSLFELSGKRTSATEAIEQLKASMSKPKEIMQTRLKVPINGFPFAVPIELYVRDKTNDQTEIRYLVILDIPYSQLQDKW